MKTFDEARLKKKLDRVIPLLDERQKRLFVAAEADQIGYGGITLLARLTGMSRVSIHSGIADLGAELKGKVRAPGGGRKPVQETQPDLMDTLDALVAPETRGDPMSPLRWTSKSTRRLSEALAEKGFKASTVLVAKLLRNMGYSLQGNSKTREGGNHPDRNGQFHYLARQAAKFQSSGQPVISVDTKKKELVGDFKNGGREYQREGEPEKVRVHDFKDPALGKAIPYGVYDVARNEGWVNVGTDHDTSTFAVESIRRWWLYMGKERYPDATQLMISADGGGSNGSRARLWKLELAKFAEEAGLKITVCHLPPGTSKWNKIEHRLFSYISMNWRGRPLVTHEVVVECIAATTTSTGLKVEAILDTGEYPTGTVVLDEELAAIKIRRHKFHGEWNYTLNGIR
ncbi:MAG: ISAzo13 family transposase [Vulcanimicrobiota bacterium]